jgi:regulator of chromosome condensation
MSFANIPRQVATKAAAPKPKAEPKPKPAPKAKAAPNPKAEAKPKPAPKPKAATASRTSRGSLPTINTRPTEILDVYVFGENGNGELGLGAKNVRGKMVIDVARPRLNPFLAATPVGIVALAVGGMHCAALTHDNQILTWGVNDQGALGRPSEADPEDVKMKDADASESESDSDDDFDEDSGLNAAEAEPRPVDPIHFPPGTEFAGLYAGDSNTFALTTRGQVYGWGTFRVSLFQHFNRQLNANCSGQ